MQKSVGLTMNSFSLVNRCALNDQIFRLTEEILTSDEFIKLNFGCDGNDLHDPDPLRPHDKDISDLKSIVYQRSCVQNLKAGDIISCSVFGIPIELAYFLQSLTTYLTAVRILSIVSLSNIKNSPTLFANS